MNDHSIETSRYSANITAGALRVRESRILAGLLIEDAADELWDRLLMHENILQLTNPSSAKRLTRLLRQRLLLLNKDGWRLVRDGSRDESVQMLLAAAILHSRLLRDFIDLSLRDLYQLYAKTLSKAAWLPFIAGCEARDPDVAAWTTSTKEKTRQVCYTILSEAGYISDTRKLELQVVRVLPRVREHLQLTPAATALPYMEVCL